jgi:transcriptional regulator with XRE-family HTH domain
MPLEEEQIRRIFGLKLRQIREKKDLSLYGLSKKTGLSKSYLNEIEKGKKYPKPDKILAIAEALDTTYDEMVSIKLSGKMGPLSDMILSGVLKEIPLNIFGIEENHLIDIIANAPEKVTAFIGTLFEMARSFDISKDYFYLSALRSYQEAHLNYFPEIEQSVKSFCNRYQINTDKKLSSDELDELLREEFGYSIIYKKINHKELDGQIRSVFVPKRKELLLDAEMSESQKVFILAKELAYCHMDIDIRPLTFSWIKFQGFEEVLNNYRASYFAGALIISEDRLKAGLERILSAKTWNTGTFFDLMFSFTESAETFFQRITNLLPIHFGINDMFFLRLSHTDDDQTIEMNKEFHMGKSDHPRAINSMENYCRRWVCTDVLLNKDKYGEQKGVRMGLQKSKLEKSGDEHLVITASNQDPFNRKVERSVCIGIALDIKQARKLKFLDSDLKDRIVGKTCERCAVKDCKERVAEPRILHKMEHKEMIEARIEKLIAELK